MKTMKTMKHFLSMAALALMGAMMTGCSNDDNINNPQPESKSKLETLTTTVSLGEDGTTRALTPGGVKTFAAGEQIAVIYLNTNSDIKKAVSTALTTTDISNEGKTATFTVTLNDPDKTKTVVYVYPASMINDNGTVNDAALATQDGTFDTLESSLDFAMGADNWNGEELPSSVSLVNQLAILAITLKDADGTNDITSTITGMTLSDGTDTYTVTREAAAGPIYVAIPPVDNLNVTISATDGTKNYFKSLTGKTYAANNGYDVSWRMYGVGDVILADGNFAARSSTTGTIVAMITYLGSSTGVEGYTHGLALALSDEGSMDWSTATGASGAAAHTPAAPTPMTSSWMLPSKDQWNKMIDACKNVLGTQNNYQDLRDGFSGISGASNLESLFGYWSSTECESDSDHVWVFYFDGVGWNEGTKEVINPLALACLAF